MKKDINIAFMFKGMLLQETTFIFFLTKIIKIEVLHFNICYIFFFVVKHSQCTLHAFVQITDFFKPKQSSITIS